MWLQFNKICKWSQYSTLVAEVQCGLLTTLLRFDLKRILKQLNLDLTVTECPNKSFFYFFFTCCVFNKVVDKSMLKND